MTRPRIVIVGGGFAGFHAARRLERLSRGAADVTLINPTDYFLYLPLLPEVAAGILEPRRVSVSLPGTLPGVRLLLGGVHHVDLDTRRVHYEELRLLGVFHHTPALIRRAVGMLADGTLDPTPLVTHEMGLRDVPKALDLMSRGQALKVLIRP